MLRPTPLSVTLPPNLPVVHPQLVQGGRHIQHYRYTTDTGLHEASNSAPPGDTIDVLAVQTRDLLSRLHTELATGDRHAGSDAVTFIIVPQLAVDWDAASLSTTLPSAAELAALVGDLPEPVTVFAGGSPAEYYHEWDLQRDHGSVTVPVAGLGATERDGAQFAQYACTTHGLAAAEAVDPDEFGLQTPHGVGPATASNPFVLQ